MVMRSLALQRGEIRFDYKSGYSDFIKKRFREHFNQKFPAGSDFHFESNFLRVCMLYGPSSALSSPEQKKRDFLILELKISFLVQHIFFLNKLDLPTGFSLLKSKVRHPHLFALRSPLNFAQYSVGGEQQYTSAPLTLDARPAGVPQVILECLMKTGGVRLANAYMAFIRSFSQSDWHTLSSTPIPGGRSDGVYSAFGDAFFEFVAKRKKLNFYVSINDENGCFDKSIIFSLNTFVRHITLD